MNNIADIRDNIKDELKHFNDIFNTAFSIEDELLKKALQHLQQQVGKQLRPMLVIYFAKLCGALNDTVYNAASAIEMLHTGSLVHDDVVDDTMQRRGLKSLNSMFDNKTAVLVGDYILTKSMKFMCDTNNIDIINSITNIGTEITRGELLQLQKAYSLPTENEYYEIIKRKTAILFTTCASVAALATNATKEQQIALETFATNIGLCFQIKDDILDYTQGAEIGKPVFNDIREGKITLPLIHTLQAMPTEAREEILQDIKDAAFENGLEDKIHNAIVEFKGIEYAIRQMDKYLHLAKEQLSIFPDSIDKNALISIANYVLDRKL